MLRRIKERDATPVIVLSGRPDEHQEKVLELGAFAFFGKPFGLNEIETAVNHAIEQAAEDEVSVD